MGGSSNCCGMGRIQANKRLMVVAVCMLSSSSGCTQDTNAEHAIPGVQTSVVLPIDEPPRDSFQRFEELVEAARERAAEVVDTQSIDRHVFTASIKEANEDTKSITIEVTDTDDSRSTTTEAVVTWAEVDGVWRVTGMTSDWDGYGLLSVIIEQQIVNRICGSLDDQYTPPQSMSPGGSNYRGHPF